MPQTFGEGRRGVLEGVLLDALLRDTTLAVAASDVDGTVTLMSPALQELVGSEFAPVPAESISTHFRVRTADGSRLLTPAEEPLNRARLGESFREQVVSLEVHGREVHLRCSGSPLRGPDDTIQGGLVLFDDITAERALLREQAALRDQLLDTVNHELRTPLSAVLGHAELLQDLDLELPPMAARSLRTIVDAGLRLRDLVQTVSDLVDLDEAARVSPSEQDVVTVVRAAIEQRQSAARLGGVQVCLFAPFSLMADVDATLLGRAVSAVLANAVQHAPRGSVVEVELSTERAEVVIEVRDTGPGMPAAERARAVQPFERGRRDLTTPAGRGLGLALTRAVVVAHRGTLELRDNGPQGLVVDLRVPRWHDEETGP